MRLLIKITWRREQILALYFARLCWARAHRWFQSETPVLFERPFELWCWRGGGQTQGLLPLSWCLGLRTFFLIYKRVWTNPFRQLIIES